MTGSACHAPQVPRRGSRTRSLAGNSLRWPALIGNKMPRLAKGLRHGTAQFLFMAGISCFLTPLQVCWAGEPKGALAPATTALQDSVIVRRILDANGLSEVPVEQVAKARGDRIVELELRGKKISPRPLPRSLTTIPEEIGQLTALEKLEIRSNEIKQLPDALFTLTKVIELDVSNNGLEALSPKIRQLVNLRKLRVGMNKLMIVPESIGSLAALEDLDLSSNDIEELPASVGDLLNLRRLDLGENVLSNLPASLEKIPRLATLSLKRNRFREIPPVVLALKSLQFLYLSENLLTTLDPKVGGLVRLESLTLDKNQLTTLPPSIGGLTRLRFFRIEGNPIENRSNLLEELFGPEERRQIDVR